MRQGMTESSLWEEAQEARAPRTGGDQASCCRRHARALAFLIVMYGVWNLVAGTYGIFFPYILDAVGSTSDRANLALQAIWFVSTALAVAFVYMPLIDRVSRRKLLIWSTRAAARGVRAVHLLRRHVPHVADQRRAVRRRRGHRPAVAVPALERRAVPDAAALAPPRASCSASCGSRSAAGSCCCRGSRTAGFRTLSAILFAMLIGRRPGRRPVRARHPGPRPGGDAGERDRDVSASARAEAGEASRSARTRLGRRGGVASGDRRRGGRVRHSTPDTAGVVLAARTGRRQPDRPRNAPGLTGRNCQRISFRNWWTIVSRSALGLRASPSSRSRISSVHSCVCRSR